MIAFEVENIYIDCASVGRLLSVIDGVGNVGIRGFFDFSREECVAFKYRSIDFIVFEPFGDNSRYWIGPRNSLVDKIDVSGIEVAFRGFKPSFFRRLVGDLLTFKIFK